MKARYRLGPVPVAMIAAAILAALATRGLQWVSVLDLAPLGWLAELARSLGPDEQWVLVLLFNLMFLAELAAALLLGAVPAALVVALLSDRPPGGTALLAAVLFLGIGLLTRVLLIIRPAYVPGLVAYPVLVVLAGVFMAGFSRRFWQLRQWLRARRSGTASASPVLQPPAAADVRRHYPPRRPAPPGCGQPPWRDTGRRRRAAAKR